MVLETLDKTGRELETSVAVLDMLASNVNTVLDGSTVSDVEVRIMLELGVSTAKGVEVAEMLGMAVGDTIVLKQSVAPSSEYGLE